MRINPDGKQVGIYGGDGGISAVDPDHSDTAYEEYTNGDMRATTDGGKTWNDITPPDDTYMFTNPFTMDAADANHLITAGTKVYETTKGTARRPATGSRSSTSAPRVTSPTRCRRSTCAA